MLGSCLAFYSYFSKFSYFKEDIPKRLLKGTQDRSICISARRRYHNYMLYSLHWSQDGSRLASSSSDHIKIWNTKNYQCISTLYGHGDGIGSVAWSQDGAWLASGSQDRTIKIWEPGVDQQKSSKIEDHSERITALVMSPDEVKLASASVDTYIKIWVLSTGNVILTLSGHTNEVSSLAWSPNGSEIASASWDGCLEIWSTTTAECISTLKSDNKLLNAVAWSPDNARLATASLDGIITVWDSIAYPYRCLFTIKDELPGAWHWALAWSQDGCRIGLGSRFGRVKILDASTRDCVASFDQLDVFANSGAWQSHKTLVHLRALLEICDYAPDTHGSLSIPTAASNYDFDGQYEWITYSNEPILRLPIEYQPNVSTVGKNFIGVGCHSGCVMLLQFSHVNPLK